MASVKAGDRVRLVQREVTAEDLKTGLYYEYFGGLTGTVDRAYDDRSVCIDVDLDSLEQAARDRHVAMQEAEKKRWLDSLGQEARSRLTPEQQRLTMSYKILVNGKDLEPFSGPRPSGDAVKGKRKAAAAETEALPKSVDKSESTDKVSSKQDDETAPKRLSRTDLDAAEEAMLQAQRLAREQGSN